MRLWLSLALAVASAVPARATDMPAMGGPGGDRFRITCNDGNFLVGLAGRAGDWVDQIRPVCAPWEPAAHRFGPAAVGIPHGDSQGGRPGQSNCPRGYAIAALGFPFTVGNDGVQFVDSIGAMCITVEPPRDEQYIQFGRAPSYDEMKLGGPWPGTHYFRPEGGSECPDGELAVGLLGRAGLFVDALGLVCVPAPHVPDTTIGSASAQIGSSASSLVVKPRKIGTAKLADAPGKKMMLPLGSTKVAGAEGSQAALVVPPAPPKPPVQAYAPPLTKSGKRLYACKSVSSDDACGAPVAATFCQQQGYLVASKLDTQTEKVIAETLSGELCTRDKCKVFDLIVCNK